MLRLYAIKSILRQIRMFFYWGWNLRKDVDYDANSIWHILALKYKRTYEHMKQCHYMKWTEDGSKDMKRLATMMHIADRFSRDEDYTVDSSLMADYTFEEIPGTSGFKRLNFNWKPGQRERFLAEGKRMEKKRQHELDTFVKYFHKYNNRFWE